MQHFIHWNQKGLQENPVKHLAFYIATWTDNRTNIYQLGRKAKVTDRQERFNESNVNKTHEKESSCLHHASMISKQFIIQLMRNI